MLCNDLLGTCIVPLVWLDVATPPQAKEAAFVEYLRACEGGKVPAKAPTPRVSTIYHGQAQELATVLAISVYWRYSILAMLQRKYIKAEICMSIKYIS